MRGQVEFAKWRGVEADGVLLTEYIGVGVAKDVGEAVVGFEFGQRVLFFPQLAIGVQRRVRDAGEADAQSFLQTFLVGVAADEGGWGIGETAEHLQQFALDDEVLPRDGSPVPHNLPDLCLGHRGLAGPPVHGNGLREFQEMVAGDGRPDHCAVQDQRNADDT